jgi:hypothetical protein
VKIGAKVIAHAHYTIFQMAEVAVPCELFVRILEMIDDLRPRAAGSMLNAAIDPTTRCSRGRCALIPARRVGLPVRGRGFPEFSSARSNSGFVGGLGEGTFPKDGLVWSATWGMSIYNSNNTERKDRPCGPSSRHSPSSWPKLPSPPHRRNPMNGALR